MVSFKKHMKREWDSMMHVMREEAKQRYEIVHEGHTIVVQNAFESTWLYIDGQLQDEVHRPTKMGKLRFSETLKATLEDYEVKVKLSGMTTLDCTFYINGKKILKEKRELNLQPWRHHPLLVPFIEQKGVEAPLPDERYYGKIHEPLDYIWQRPEEGYEESLANKLAKKVDWLLEKPIDKTRISLYEDVMDDDFITYVRQFRDALETLELDESALYNEAKWFIKHAAHRYVLAFGIVLLGRAHALTTEHTLIKQLGYHPIFAPFVALALEHGDESATAFAAEFIQSPYESVYLKTMTPVTEDIKQYYVMNAPFRYDDSETAIDYAQKGELYKALRADVIDDALYERATEFLLPMLEDYEAVITYSDFAPMTLEYVKHAKTRAVTYEKLYPVAKLHLYMKEDADDALEMEHISAVTRNLVLSATEAILKSANWRPAIEKAFAAQRNMEYALTIARAAGEDYVQLAYQKVVNGYFEPYLYEAIVMSKNQDMIEKTVHYVEQFELATLNPVELESVLIIIHALENYEGIGLLLIEKALNARDNDIVQMALWTIESWSPEYYRTKGIEQALLYISRRNEDRQLRKMAKALMKSMKDASFHE